MATFSYNAIHGDDLNEAHQTINIHERPFPNGPWDPQEVSGLNIYDTYPSSSRTTQAGLVENGSDTMNPLHLGSFAIPTIAVSNLAYPTMTARPSSSMYTPTPHQGLPNHQDQIPLQHYAPIAATTEYIVIGMILSNGTPRDHQYKCHFDACSGTTFRRLADLKRHHTVHHSTAPPQFWCDVPWCERSVERGNRPFARRDKLVDHVVRVHERTLRNEYTAL